MTAEERTEAERGAGGMVPIPEGTRAMLFAAGLGTRLKPFTDSHPKALAPVNGKPLLQRNIEYLRNHGIRDIIVNVHHFAGQIEEFLLRNANFDCNIVLSHEEGEPLETGGGLLKAAGFLTEPLAPFFAMNADILTDLDLRRIYRTHLDSDALATLAVTPRKSSRRLLFDGAMLLCGWRDERTGETRISRPDARTLQPLAFSCVHVIAPGMPALIRQRGKFSIIETYLDLAREHRIMGHLHGEDTVIDVGRPESILEAERHFH